ncbi:hypothetical protein [Arenimonas oryziterrae]|uniref:Tetratricopeptide repeat protein n=1 Tax=Arenimonas oryziterrae DSM 21050 = YC6267 TaxID=1121015 RepID=A0A091AUK9_9GAMM|nr:hypothetical protein [Arenimonas oryziterrae]KFN43121.1 hypothetical protein N789_11200 [Arenimonas oryziterrae DSM 21050 = YC6267]
MQDPTQTARHTIAPYLLLGIVALYLFLAWPALRGPFIFDDFPNLGVLSKFGDIDSWRKLGQFLAEARGFPGRPLAMLSFLPQQADWPDNPFPFKLVNLALHLINAGLIFVLLRRVARIALPDHAKAAAIIAGLSATLWLVHPMQISTVMLVVQRMTLLSTLFVLLGLLAYVHGLTSQYLSAGRRAAWLTGGIVLGTGLSVLCKENGVLLPLYAWVLDATLLRADVANLPARLRQLRRLLLFPALALLAAYFAYLMRDPFAALPTRDFTLAERLMTQPRMIFDYLTDIVLPRYAQYGIYHDDLVASRGLLQPWTTLAAIVGLVAALALAFWQRQRRPLLAFAILWYLGGHALEAGPIPLELYFEHRNYLPLIGPLFAIVAGLASLPMDTPRRAGSLVLGLWLLASLFASALYAQVWSNEDKLTYFWASRHPASVRSQAAFASRLFDTGMMDGARQILADASKLRPKEVGLDLSSAMVSCRMRTLTAKDVDALRLRLSQATWSHFAVETMSSLRTQASAGECAPVLGETQWLGLSEALLGNPAFQADGYALGQLHYQRHTLAASHGDLDTALKELDEVAKYDPDPEIPRLKAKYLVEAGVPEMAIETLRDYDASRRPLLRRLLVDDAAINREAIAAINARAATPAK